MIAKAGLLGMYASCGFALKGLSPVVHGKDPWFEMTVDLDATEPRLLRFLQVRDSRGKSVCTRVVIYDENVGCYAAIPTPCPSFGAYMPVSDAPTTRGVDEG